MAEDNTEPKVYWAALMERNVIWEGVSSLLNVAMMAGHLEYTRLILGYARTDAARNQAAKMFRAMAGGPDDALVMLDNDHVHDMNVIEQLASRPHEIGVVGALAFLRGAPYNPCAMIRAGDGHLHPIAEWPPDSLLACDCIGHAAVAIKRWVFDRLEEKGFRFPYWRYTYTDGDEALPSEDMYFGHICEKAGIAQYVDTSLVAPHAITAWVDGDAFDAYRADHVELQEVLPLMREQPGEGELNIPPIRTRIEA